VNGVHVDTPAKDSASNGPSSILRSGAPEDLTFLDLLIIVARRKTLIALVTALGALVALLVAFVLPPEYTATVTILPRRVHPSMGTIQSDESTGKDLGSRKVTVVREPADLNDMYVSILKTHSVEDSVIQRYGLVAEYGKRSLTEARGSLEDHTKIDGSNKDGLLRLSFSSRNPERASEIANGYIEQFESLSKHLVIPGTSSEDPFIQVVDPATPPEQRSSPMRGRIALAGASVGFTIGVMLALLQGGLVRMQQHPETREKFDLLRRSVSFHRSRELSDQEDVRGLRAGSEAVRQ
jgi:uncharacterized protein involved in exopolysaccharide biosynthesis